MPPQTNNAQKAASDEQFSVPFEIFLVVFEEGGHEVEVALQVAEGVAVAAATGGQADAVGVPAVRGGGG